MSVRHARAPGLQVVQGRPGALASPPCLARRGEPSGVTEAPPRLSAGSPCGPHPLAFLLPVPHRRAGDRVHWGRRRIENNGCNSASKQVFKKGSLQQFSLPLPASFIVLTLKAADVSVTTSRWCWPHPCLQGNPGTQARKRPIVTQGDACCDAGGRSTEGPVEGTFALGLEG